MFKTPQDAIGNQLGQFDELIPTTNQDDAQETKAAVEDSWTSAYTVEIGGKWYVGLRYEDNTNGFPAGYEHS